MMPGENQSGAGGIASEASFTCQNCTVLNQSLDEYVSALLTLKQKIIDTDFLLSEYKEKCDELQKSQRESAKLHKELDEVLLKLGPLEKQTADYEQAKAELETTTAALKVYRAKSEEADVLRGENAKALVMNAKLEETLKKVEDAANAQNVENAKLKSEKKMLESDLQTTRESLRLCQQAVEEVENLKLRNAKDLILKSNLENQLLALEDVNLKQSQTIQDLESKNNNLENSIKLIEEKLVTLEQELNKEKRCSSTQTENEPKVDKAKVWTLLQEVWRCVDPLSKTTENSDLNDSQQLMFRPPRSPPCPLPINPFRNLMPQSTVPSPKGNKVSPEKSKSQSVVGVKSPCKEQKKKKIGRKKEMLESEDLDENCTKTDGVSDMSLNKDGPDHLLKGRNCSKTPNMWDILSVFWPLPAPISPLPPDESDEMDIDSSLKEDSISKPEDDQKSQYTEPKPLEDGVVVSSVCLSPGNQLSLVKSSVASDIDNKSLQKDGSESQEMPVEKMCKMKEDSEDTPCTGATLPVQTESHVESVDLNQVRITTESQLSNLEECTNQIDTVARLQCVPEVPEADCSDGLGQGSEPVQETIILEEGQNIEDKSIENQSEVKANVSGHSLQSSLMPQSCSKTEPERTTDEVQSVFIPVVTTADLKAAEDGGQDGESSCTKINGGTSGEFSNENLFGQSRKVTGSCLRLGDLDSVASNEKQVSVAQVQETNSITKDLQTKEDKDDGHLNDGSNTTNLCKPVILADSGVDDDKETVLIKDYKHESEHCPGKSFPTSGAYNQQEEVILAGSFGPNIAHVDSERELKDDGAKPRDSSVKSYNICPASVANTHTLSNIDTSVTLPLTDFASKIVLSSTLSAESIGKVLTEMGPPLPPVVLPLSATPPKLRKHLTPAMPSIPVPTWSSTDGPFSLKQQSKVPSPDPGQEEVKTSLPTTTPSPSCGVPTSPLQFGSATPKHALPVPGRLPSSALNSSSPSSTQENSMQMLDTMYPELSAQARTLNILRGNVNLGRGANENGASPPSVNPISGNKTINSSSTAFTKTDHKAKRFGANVLLPKSAKRLRLDTCSPDPANPTPPAQDVSDDKQSSGLALSEFCPMNSPSSKNLTNEGKTVDGTNDAQSLISSALEKLHNSLFDVLPVIKSHVYLGRISEVPVLKDEEKCVISDFCVNQSSAEEFMTAILSKLKVEKAIMKHELLQSYCRVYVGLCRCRRDHQKAHAFAYSLLKEDFPEAPKLILFVVSTWPSILSPNSPLCSAINIVSRLKAEGDILDYLKKYLHWDERPPADIHKTIPTILKALLEDDTLMFQKHDRHGVDLCPTAWEYIFSLDLLCAHLGWKWTHDNIIGKQLWPVMNAWVTQPRSAQAPVRDVCVAAVLRLIGRLGQLGLKEKLCTSVQNVAKAINLFGKHGIAEGVPWEVQISAVYTIYDLAPSNPKESLEALATWRGEISQPVPSAVTSCITQLGSICRQIKP